MQTTKFKLLSRVQHYASVGYVDFVCFSAFFNASVTQTVPNMNAVGI